VHDQRKQNWDCNSFLPLSLLSCFIWKLRFTTASNLKISEGKLVNVSEVDSTTLVIRDCQQVK
jgi:hypothetical protein